LRTPEESQVSHSSEKWDQLTKEWAESLKKAKTRQAIIDDKMHSFLRGNGCLPTTEELQIVEQLWQQHVEARNRTNQFIQAVLQNYTTTDATS
jgi:tRNA/tmRNA/rRNA uracil-C5-methylase (TrmA/RlmC/RlmD family)